MSTIILFTAVQKFPGGGGGGVLVGNCNAIYAQHLTPNLGREEGKCIIIIHVQTTSNTTETSNNGHPANIL